LNKAVGKAWERKKLFFHQDWFWVRGVDFDSQMPPRELTYVVKRSGERKFDVAKVDML
jgi:hypothetical protein